MPQSKITAQMVKDLRNETGAGMVECKAALEKCKGDILLAEGWLKYYGCAINTYDTPHEEWAMTGAQAWKRALLEERSKSK